MNGYTGASAWEAMWWVLVAMGSVGIFIVIGWAADHWLSARLRAQHSGVSDDES